MDINRVVPSDFGYLKRLECLEKPPEKLCYFGKIPECDSKTDPNPRFPTEAIGRPKTVAIVGARKMTTYGETYAFKFAKELAELGIIVVSGLATGIDSAAHRGALAGNGRTIAFLGTQIDKIYPSENRKLFEEILKRDGCILSEYDISDTPHPKTSFLERNRLIAGLSDAVIIIEADLRSGSLNTAAHALEQGVPLFALPGDLSRQMSRGCNQLFNKGASAITDIKDVLNVVLPGNSIEKKRQKIELFGSTPDEVAVLKILARGMTSGEEILKKIQKTDREFNVSRFNIAITMLEVRGLVKRELGNQWILL